MFRHICYIIFKKTHENFKAFVWFTCLVICEQEPNVLIAALNALTWIKRKQGSFERIIYKHKYLLLAFFWSGQTLSTVFSSRIKMFCNDSSNYAPNL